MLKLCKSLLYRVIDLVGSLPRNRYTYRVIDRARAYLYNHSMSSGLSWLCHYCGYRIGRNEPHEHCDSELYRLYPDKYRMPPQFEELDAPLTFEDDQPADDDVDWPPLAKDDVYYDEEMLDDDPDEDPLAGDVEPTGGYYEPTPSAFEAQGLQVMRQHGDWTE